MSIIKQSKRDFIFDAADNIYLDDITCSPYGNINIIIPQTILHIHHMRQCIQTVEAIMQKPTKCICLCMKTYLEKHYFTP